MRNKKKLKEKQNINTELVLGKERGLKMLLNKLNLKNKFWEKKWKIKNKNNSMKMKIKVPSNFQK